MQNCPFDRQTMTQQKNQECLNTIKRFRLANKSPSLLFYKTVRTLKLFQIVLFGHLQVNVYILTLREIFECETRCFINCCRFLNFILLHKKMSSQLL